MFHLTELLGLPVYDVGGVRVGTVEEVAARPAVTPARVSLLVIRERKGKPPLCARLTEVASFSLKEVRLRVLRNGLEPFQPDEALLLLRKDLLDQQIIDVNGRKVVRVNDVTFADQPANSHTELLLTQVDIGLAGALRRLWSGAMPRALGRKLEASVKGTSIRWEFVDLLETDPRRRIKLNISHRVLTKLHPADLADIMEELAPKERQAIFTALDNATAAATLAEVPRKMQVSILESLGRARAAGIVEEMPPDAAADLLGELPDETSSELLQDMNREEAEELGELLEFGKNTAGGLMTTEYIALPATADVKTAIDLIVSTTDLPENFHTIFLVEADGRLAGTVPLSHLIVARPEHALLGLKLEPPLRASVDDPEEDVVELFDKYNLLVLPVVDREQGLAGVVTADDIVSLLRRK